MGGHALAEEEAPHVPVIVQHQQDVVLRRRDPLAKFLPFVEPDLRAHAKGRLL